jgi:hypothetical protein
MTVSTSLLDRKLLALAQLPSQAGAPDADVAPPLTLAPDEPEPPPPQELTKAAHRTVNQRRLIRVPPPVESLSS